MTLNRGDWHKPQIRWHLKAYGWRQITLMTPVLWRWAFYVTLRLFPESNWLIGVSFGNSSYDDDPYLMLRDRIRDSVRERLMRRLGGCRGQVGISHCLRVSGRLVDICGLSFGRFLASTNSWMWLGP